MAKWEMQKRQEWIENKKEPFRRTDLMVEFNINITTASTDIQTYKKWWRFILRYE